MFAAALLLNAGRRVVEHALLAGTRRADIAARVAASATGELALPEREALVGRHLLELFDLVEAVRVDNLSVLAEKLVIRDVLFRLAVAGICSGRTSFASIVTSPS